jgi:four helix bundle protein
VKENVIKEKSYAFALVIVPFCRRLQEQREYLLSRQLTKSGTSIGANVEEAQAAQSRPDFLSKMSIAPKEARESNYWLRVLRDCGEFPDFEFGGLGEFSEELVRILTSIVKTTGES